MAVAAVSGQGHRFQPRSGQRANEAVRENIMWGSDRAAGPMSGATTLIAPGTQITGDIEFSGDLEIQGLVRGNIHAAIAADKKHRARVRVVEGGRVEGEIHAPLIMINGAVVGDIHAGDQVELAAKAEVEGNIHYRVIEIIKGAQFSGQLIYTAESEPAVAVGVADPLEAE